MTRADLVLWMLIYPWPTAIAGLATGLTTFWLAAPRRVVGCDSLKVEAWRMVALVTMLPAFFLGAEAVLWGRLLAYRAPLAFTGLIGGLGWWLAALAGVPLSAWWCWRSRRMGGRAPGAAHDHAMPPAARVPRPVWLAGVLLAAGAGCISGGASLRAAAWSAAADRAAADPEAILEVIRLKSFRYIGVDEAVLALDRAVPSNAAIPALARDARDLLDGDVRAYLADRLDAGLAASPTDPVPDVVATLWDLTGDPARTVRAYALTRPELRPGALGGAALDWQAAAASALRQPAGTRLTGAVLDAADALAAADPLDPPLLEALVRYRDAAPPAGPTAVGILLRDGSERALRPILPRFAGATGTVASFGGPSWTVLRQRCMQRTTALVRLTGDIDPAVATGARAVLDYVRQYCRRARPVG